jgi:FAD/FMN-containing dehydrogenase
MDPKLIELQRNIKQVFDPLNILNPGKIFPAGDRPQTT